MAILRTEFARLREHVGAPPPQPRPAAETSPQPPPPPPPPPRPAASAPSPSSTPPGATPPPNRAAGDKSFGPGLRQGPSVEELIGRYGTIAVATITVLVGVGIFLNWAIQHNLLGPEARVVLGYLLAVGFAAGGLRLRMRGTREFGNVLLAMALGIVHLVCWSAGPRLHVLPSTVALTIGFLASAALAEFALSNDEEPLCAIGFGGAAIAPFVTSDDSGNLIALAVYGVAVVALSAAALGDRPWRVALNVTIASFVVFELAVIAGHQGTTAWPGIATRLGSAFPIAVLIAVIPFTHARHRRTMLRMAGGGVVAGALLRGPRSPDLVSLMLTVGAAILTIAVLDLTRPGALEREAAVRSLDGLVAKRNAVIDALILPVAFFFAAIALTPGFTSAQSAEIAALWTVLAVFMTHHARAEPEADKYAITGCLTALWIVPASLPDHELLRVIGMVGVGIALMLTALRLQRQPFAAAGIVALGIASLWSVVLLETRPPFNYTPFGTPATGVTVIAILGWVVALRITQQPEFLPALAAPARSQLRALLISGAAVTAFLWGRGELAEAWNPSAAVALLTLYYAAGGTAMIWLGRTRKIQPLRAIGLGLALLAAGKALLETFHLPNVAVRIATIFAVSAFLIAVGYWYRRGADDEPAATTGAST